MYTSDSCSITKSCPQIVQVVEVYHWKFQTYKNFDVWRFPTIVAIVSFGSAERPDIAEQDSM